MPLTAVIKVSNAGALQQLQIGAADIVATLAAAHSAWGWIGGLTGVSSFLQFCQRKDDLDRMKKIFKFIESEYASCHVLGQQGLVTLPLTNDDNTFGGTPGSKLLGATLCALAHVMDPRAAVKVLQSHFLEQIFQSCVAKYPGSKETIHTFLADNYQQIINEGIVNHLNERFDEAISDLGLSCHWKASSHPLLKTMDSTVSYPHTAEPRLVQGFLKWILGENSGQSYFTRSATVARLATCMKCVGYQIAGVLTWDGSGDRPSSARSLVLVTGGSSETDPFLEIEHLMSNMKLVNHYHWQTVGAMLWTSSSQECASSLYETLQQDFEDTHTKVKELLLGFRWAFVDLEAKDVQAFPIWADHVQSTASRIATRLASILFPENAERIACLYEKIASEKYLEAAKSHSRARNRTIGPEIGHSKESQRFRAMSASICISILGCVAGDGFEDMRHSTLLDFTNSYDLAQLCAQVDLILTGGYAMSKVITAVAAIHCAADNTAALWYADVRGNLGAPLMDSDSSSRVSVIGWRTGRYAVLPALLFSMDSTLEKSVLGLRCTDMFIANIPTQPDGSIRCPNSLPGTLRYDHSIVKEAAKQVEDPEQGQTSMEYNNAVFLGPPSRCTPDKALYISLERPSYGFGDALVSLCGRLNGESLGNVSIQQILITLALSMSNERGEAYSFCSEGQKHPDHRKDDAGLVSADRVLNVPASRYCRSVDVAVLDDLRNEPKHNVYVQIQGNTPWAIFLAGQNSIQNRVTFGCPQCSVHTGSNFTSAVRMGLTTLLGYY